MSLQIFFCFFIFILNAATDSCCAWLKHFVLGWSGWLLGFGIGKCAMIFEKKLGVVNFVHVVLGLGFPSLILRSNVENASRKRKAGQGVVKRL